MRNTALARTTRSIVFTDATVFYFLPRAAKFDYFSTTTKIFVCDALKETFKLYYMFGRRFNFAIRAAAAYAISAGGDHSAATDAKLVQQLDATNSAIFTGTTNTLKITKQKNRQQQLTTVAALRWGSILQCGAQRDFFAAIDFFFIQEFAAALQISVALYSSIALLIYYKTRF